MSFTSNAETFYGVSLAFVFIGILLWIFFAPAICLDVGHHSGYDRGKKYMEQEIINRGHADWVVGGDGTVHFKWRGDK